MGVKVYNKLNFYQEFFLRKAIIMRENNYSAALPLSILKNLENEYVFSSFLNWKESRRERDKATFLGRLIERGAEDNFWGYICDAVLTDENAFALRCASGELPSKYAIRAFTTDIRAIFTLISGTESGKDYAKGAPKPPFCKFGDDAALINDVYTFYKSHGYGQFIEHRAFRYEGGVLYSVKNPSDVTLKMLKGYSEEKSAVESNILNLLNGLPFANMLLYGDMGTGKSSTVHAMLNKYFEHGLRLIEINVDDLKELVRIKDILHGSLLKFIIFIDDLSLNENDERLSGLKAVLEGSVSGSAHNAMIVATSNRRHIVRENFSDRQNAVHTADMLQEQLSLSDRFGITVMFSSTDKSYYLEIVRQLAADEKLYADGEFFALAERWALVKGGRSPRRARQFIDLAVSSKERGVPIQF